MNFINGSRAWNPHAKFLIYLNQQANDGMSMKMELTYMVLSKFWQNQVINIIVIAPDNDHSLQKSKVMCCLLLIDLLPAISLFKLET